MVMAMALALALFVMVRVLAMAALVMAASDGVGNDAGNGACDGTGDARDGDGCCPSRRLCIAVRC